MRVYIDVFLLVNFLVDYLLLAGTNRLAGYPPDRKRLLAAGVLGAAYSGCCLLPGFRFLGDPLWRCVCLLLMGGIAFGISRSALGRCGLFLVLSFALGGLAVAIGRSEPWALALAVGGLWCLGRLSADGAVGSRHYIPIEITCGTGNLRLLALRDTGNTLTDPITGQQALVVTASAAGRLTGLTMEQLKDPLQTMASRPIPGLRLLPFRTVGQGRGMMLAMVLEVAVAGKKQKTLVAFAPENFGMEAGYEALAGGAGAW